MFDCSRLVQVDGTTCTKLVDKKSYHLQVSNKSVQLQACGCVHKSIPNLPTSCNGIFNGKSFQKLIEFEETDFY